MDITNCTISTCPISESKIGYIPNLGGNVFLVAWFALMLLLQVILGLRYRTFTYLFGQFIGLLLEIVGYAARAVLHSHPFSNGAFVAYIITITIAPAFLSYTIYLGLGRIVLIYGPQLSLLPFRAYTLIFVTTDIVCLILQAAGAGLSQASDISPAGLNHAIQVLKAGLGLQVASLAIFVVLAIDLALRLARKRSRWNTRFERVRQRQMFRMSLVGFFTAAVLILIRSAYRIDELKNGFSTTTADSQTLYMIFEGAMIGMASLLLTVFHPGLTFGTAWNATSFFSKQPEEAGAGPEATNELDLDGSKA